MATYTPTATEIVHYTKADFRRRPIVEAVHIVQYDDSMPILAVELYSDGLIYQAPSTNTFRLRFSHGDGTFSNVESIGTNADRTVVYFRVTPAMTYKFGLRRPVVEMTAGAIFASSSEIPVMIDRNPIQEGDEESYSEYTGIIQLINGKIDKSAQASKDSTMTQEVGIDSDGKLWSVPGGTSDHNELTNRDASDQHPISAITNLSSELTGKISKSAQSSKDSTMTQAVGIDSDGKLWSYADPEKLFVIRITGNDPYSADKTYSEISSAITSGMTCVCLYEGNVYVKVYSGSDGYGFGSSYNSESIITITTINIDDSNEVTISLSHGGGGTSDYEDLENLPQINGVTLEGDKSFEDLGLEKEEAVEYPIEEAQLMEFVTSISSESTDEEVASAKAVYDFTSGKIDKSVQASKDSTMTQEVGIDADGKLWSVPGEDLETDEVTEIEVPLYTITYALEASVTLKNYDTTIFEAPVSTIAVTLPTPTMGNDYLTGIIFEAASGQQINETAPTGYMIKWKDTPTWTAGNGYEIIYRCTWLTDSQTGDVIISAKWGEI